MAPNKQKVLNCLPKVAKLSDSAKDLALNKIAGANFHNRSQFDFDRLVADPNHIAANLRHYINGYSASFGYWRVTVEQPLTDEKGNDITNRDGSPKPDPKLRDYENIPFLKKDRNKNLIPQTIEEYIEREVNPHLPKAWVDESKTKIGYEINFTKYFYEFKPLRSLAEIRADILALETSSLELEKAMLED